MKKLILSISILFLSSCITRPVVLTMKDKEIIPEKSYYEMMLDSFLNEPFQPVYDWETVIVDTSSWQVYKSLLDSVKMVAIKEVSDTIPTILIYIDTSWQEVDVDLGHIYDATIKYETKDYNIKWMDGFRVNKIESSEGSWSVQSGGYLDQDKQPLSKNTIIILMTK